MVLLSGCVSTSPTPKQATPKIPPPSPASTTIEPTSSPPIVIRGKPRASSRAEFDEEIRADRVSNAANAEAGAMDETEKAPAVKGKRPSAEMQRLIEKDNARTIQENEKRRSWNNRLHWKQR